jgi:hypothetical protein
MSSPTAPKRPVEIALAAMFGRYPSVSAASRIRRRVFSLAAALDRPPFKTLLTNWRDTPRCRAIAMTLAAGRADFGE